MSPFAMIFPGQGSQAAGMGRSLAETFPAAREAFEEADEALGEAISRLCFEGPDEELQLTRNTQPALLAVSVAALRAWRSQGGPEPVAVAGHSLGEYSAHVAAGTLDFGDALRAVRLRGEAMQEAVPVGEGAMAALLGLEAPAVEQLCAELAQGQVLQPANFNAPTQIVVSGHAGAVERVVAAARDRGARKAVLLPVSAPFHCALMQPAARRLAEHLSEVSFRDPQVPVVANVDGEPRRGGEESREALVRQVVAPVQWVACMGGLGSLGAGAAVELGAGAVLKGLAKRIDRKLPAAAAGDPAGIEDALEMVGEKA
jgi:[acyl-carrier-protein] S-malonyltransferase